MAKIYERLLSANILREKRRDSFDPQRENLLGEDSICMVNTGRKNGFTLNLCSTKMLQTYVCC